MTKFYSMRKNKNRGYQQLNIWQNARQLYVLTWKIVKQLPPELRRIISNQMASVDSIHRNIAEGYCRKGLKEYLQFLNYAISSLGESVSSINVYRAAGQISYESFNEWDALAYKTENQMINLIKKLEFKKQNKDWNDTFIVEEDNPIYGEDGEAIQADLHLFLTNLLQ